MKQLKKITVALFLLLTLVFTACSPTGQVAQQDTVQIGGLFALSNFGSEWGTDELYGTLLAIDERNANGGINGKQIKLTVEDTQTSTTSTLSAYNKLVGLNGLDIIIGPTWEADGTALAPVASEDDVVVVMPSSYVGVQTSSSDNLFAVYPPYAYELTTVRSELQALEYTNWAIVYNDQFFSEIMKDIFVDFAKENNWNTDVYLQSTDDNDFRTILLQLEKGDYDAIYLPIAIDVDKGLFQKQLVELGMSNTYFILSTSSTESRDLVNKYGIHAENIVYPYPATTETYEEFEEAFVDMYGRVPVSPSAATAYDAANMLFDAMEQGATTPAEISMYLRSLENYEGASNTITFTNEGIIETKEHTLKVIRNGEFVAFN